MSTNETLLDIMLDIAERLAGTPDELRRCAAVIADMARLTNVRADAKENGVSDEEIADAIKASDK